MEAPVRAKPHPGAVGQSTGAVPERFVSMQRQTEHTGKSSGTRRAILAVGILLCIGLSVVGAYLLGWLDRLGIMD